MANDTSETLPIEAAFQAMDLGDSQAYLSPNHSAEEKRRAFQGVGKNQEKDSEEKEAKQDEKNEKTSEVKTPEERVDQSSDSKVPQEKVDAKPMPKQKETKDEDQFTESDHDEVWFGPKFGSKFDIEVLNLFTFRS